MRFHKLSNGYCYEMERTDRIVGPCSKHGKQRGQKRGRKPKEAVEK